MKTEQIANTRTGRPRGFDEDAALDAAMRLFWVKSYDGATLSELTQATGINRSSMWAAFGNKEALFRLAVDRYASIHMAYLSEALTLTSIREVVQTMVRGTVAFLSTPGNPKGCLSVQGALSAATGSEQAKALICDLRRRGIVRLRKRLERAKEEGELPLHLDPADFARYLSSVISGLAIQAVTGASRTELQRTGDLVLMTLGYA
jgi:AcrR family transcriptional regulator